MRFMNKNDGNTTVIHRCKVDQHHQVSFINNNVGKVCTFIHLFQYSKMKREHLLLPSNGVNPMNVVLNGLT